MRVNLFFILVCIAFCTYGCSDESAPFSEQLVEMIDTNNVASMPESAVTAPTAEVWAALKFVRERDLRMFTEIGRDVVGAEIYDVEVMKVEELDAWQVEYYNRYIDAGGIANIGNVGVVDASFIAAREAVLVMTSKYPALRDRLKVEHGFYLILARSVDETG